MERLDLGLNTFSRRAGSVEVAHSTTALRRGLEPGEQVLVRDGEQHLFATVRDISFDLTDTHYRLELGAPVEQDVVELMLGEAPATGPMTLNDVLGLLRDARRVAGRRSRPAAAVTR